MERQRVRVKESQADLLLSGFRMVLVELYRDDLEPLHKEYVEETLNEIAKNCVNQGLGRELAQIKKDVEIEEKLKALRESWIAGEIAL